MFKHFTSFLLTVSLVLSLCFFTPTEVSAETVSSSNAKSDMLSAVYFANLIEPAVITADGTITAKFNIVSNIEGLDAKTVEKAQFKYLPNESHPDLKISYDLKFEEAKNGIKFINLSKSLFTVTGKLNSPISSGTTLGILNISDHDTIESVALNLENRESFKYEYSYPADMHKKAYLYWDAAKGSTLDSLINKDILFNPEPDFFGKNNMNYTWNKHYMCNNNILFDKSGREFSHEDHNKLFELYFMLDLPDSDTNVLYGMNPDASVNMAFDPNNPEATHTKYPTDYVLRDLSKSPLIIPNEKGESAPLIKINKESTEIIKHDPASIYNNPSDKKIKYQWNIKGNDGSNLSTETDKPELSFVNVSGIKSNVVYNITCNAVLTDLSGSTIDELSYADTHMVQTSFDTKPVAAPKTGDNAPLGLLLIAMVLMSAALMSNYAFYRKNNK